MVRDAGPFCRAMRELGVPSRSQHHRRGGREAASDFAALHLQYRTRAASRHAAFVLQRCVDSWTYKVANENPRPIARSNPACSAIMIIHEAVIQHEELPNFG